MAESVICVIEQFIYQFVLHIFGYTKFDSKFFYKKNMALATERNIKYNGKITNGKGHLDNKSP